MLRLRRRKKAAWEIAAEVGVSAAPVSRHLKAEGLGRLWRIEEAEDPVVCVDDHTRLAYAEVHPSENAVCATQFFRVGRFAGSRAWASAASAPDRQRQVLQLERLHGPVRREEHQPAFHPSLHASDQRQGRALHPDPQAPLGLSSGLPDLGAAGGLAATLGHALPSPPTHRALGKVPPIARLTASCQ